MGRPKGSGSKYTPELAAQICDKLSEGKSLREVCEAEGMPTETAVRKWAHDPAHPFSSQYARAREVGYLHMADRLLDVADDARNDWMDKYYGEHKERVPDPETAQRSKLRVETRKWILARMLPKVYGDKVEVKHDAAGLLLEVVKGMSEDKK